MKGRDKCTEGYKDNKDSVEKKVKILHWNDNYTQKRQDYQSNDRAEMKRIDENSNYDEAKKVT